MFHIFCRRETAKSKDHFAWHDNHFSGVVEKTASAVEKNVMANRVRSSLRFKDFLNDVAVDVGQAEIATRVAVRQFLMIQPHDM